MKAIEIEFNPVPEPDIYKSFYDIAKTACGEIEVFNPEIIIVLAHGGWSVLWALEALWTETKVTCVPPVVVLNIGREKLERYYQQRPVADWVQTHPYIADYAGAIENGYFLAWLSHQSDWQTELREKVLQPLNGKIPERILVLDDGNFSGGTYRIMLGLLQDVFPDASTSMLVGEGFEWKEEIAQIWLGQIGFSAEEQVKLFPDVSRLVTGTVDTDPDSLDWQTIAADHAHVSRLSKSITAEKLLALPDWAKTQIQSGVKRCLLGKAPTSSYIMRPKLDIYELIIKYIWIKKEITVRELSARLGISTQKTTAILNGFVNEEFLIKKLKGNKTYYELQF